METESRQNLAVEVGGVTYEVVALKKFDKEAPEEDWPATTCGRCNHARGPKVEHTVEQIIPSVEDHQLRQRIQEEIDRKYGILCQYDCDIDMFLFEGSILDAPA